MKLLLLPAAAAALMGMLPFPAGMSGPRPAAAPDIDGRLERAWTQEGLKPATLCDDATFLRRASLDITGRIPAPGEVKAFLADRDPGKRAKAVDRLLDSPAYADFWTGYWDRVLLGRGVRANQVDRGAFDAWLRARFAANAPWDAMVRDLVAATGRSSAGDRPKVRPGGFTQVEPGATEAGVNGAVNWTLKYLRSPQDLGGAAARTFLGVQIQCAQCHDHKTEPWKAADFKAWTSSFAMIRAVPVERGRTLAPGQLRRFDLVETPRIAFAPPKAEEARAYLESPPRALDGTRLPQDATRRRALTAWMTDPKNPWFAQALTNRLWAHFLGRGFVEPFDDLRPSNPPRMPDLFQALSADFADHGFDLKHLIRVITASRAYQREAGGVEGDRADALWSRQHLKPLAPEVLLDALVDATGLGPVFERVAGERQDRMKQNLLRQFVVLFDVDEDREQEDFQGTISQALMLLNGRITQDGTRSIPGTAVERALGLPDDRSRIEALYLRALGRPPRPEEMARWMAFLAAKRPAPGPAGGAPEPRAQALGDLLWCLLNTSEFSFNH